MKKRVKKIRVMFSNWCKFSLSCPVWIWEWDRRWLIRDLRAGSPKWYWYELLPLWSPASRQTSRSESPQSHCLVQFVNLTFVFASLLSPHSFHGLGHQVFYLVENSLLGLSATSVQGSLILTASWSFWSFLVCVDGVTSHDRTPLPPGKLHCPQPV